MLNFCIYKVSSWILGLHNFWLQWQTKLTVLSATDSMLETKQDLGQTAQLAGLSDVLEPYMGGQ